MSIRILSQAAFVNPDINPKAVPSIHPNTWNADGMVRETRGHIGGRIGFGDSVESNVSSDIIAASGSSPLQRAHASVVDSCLLLQ